ncbi:MAG TPA: DUF4238 domain-containing protein [Novosphingobium sp.]
MSGKKQHFIPQSLLSGFGFQKRDRTYVVAYTYDRGTFTPAIDGIGAERYFYSELAVDGATETLDDKITNYEQSFPKLLSALRSLNDGERVDDIRAAEFVTHLAVRNDHFRKSVTAGAARLFGGMAEAFADEGTARGMLGLIDERPSGAFAEEIAKMWGQYGSLFSLAGMSEDQFTALMFAAAKESFSSFHLEMADQISTMFDRMTDGLPSVAASSQRKSLSESLSPPLRIEKLATLEWRVDYTSSALVLPDCVSVVFDRNGDVHPTMLADLDELETVLMPLSSNRLLVGSRRGDVVPQELVNDAFVGCSWDFFVARDGTSELENKRKLLRTRVFEVVDDIVAEAISEAVPGGIA